MINIEKSSINNLIGYIDTLLDFVDVEADENIELVNGGYDKFVKPIIEKLYEEE